MEIRKKRKFEMAFKRQVVQEIESGQISATAAAKKYELSPNLIQQWREKFREGALKDGPTKRERDLEKELERYKVLLAEAHAEKEFLKKADRYVRRQRKLESAVITGLNWEEYRGGAK
jgi:transposase-like protein